MQSPTRYRYQRLTLWGQLVAIGACDAKTRLHVRLDSVLSSAREQSQPPNGSSILYRKETEGAIRGWVSQWATTGQSCWPLAPCLRHGTCHWQRGLAKIRISLATTCGKELSCTDTACTALVDRHEAVGTERMAQVGRRTVVSMPDQKPG